MSTVQQAPETTPETTQFREAAGVLNEFLTGLEFRVSALEDIVRFVVTFLSVTKVEQSALRDPQGRPYQGRQVTATLLDHYLTAKAQQDREAATEHGSNTHANLIEPGK